MPKAPVSAAELQVLHYVHDHHPVTVRAVADHFARTQGHARTTTLTLIARLVRKGHLSRKKIGDVYHYSPRVPRTQLLRGLVGDFVNKALGGSVSPFVAYLADADLSAEERDQLKQLVERLDVDSRARGTRKEQTR